MSLIKNSHARIAGIIPLVAALFIGEQRSSAQEAMPPGFPAGIQLRSESHGEAAITALGRRLPEVAAFYHKSPEQLRALFRSDRSLRADKQGRLFHICDLRSHADAPQPAGTTENIGPTDPPPFSTSDTFLLHSRPGANRVIYLDFNGHTDASGSWGAGATSPPFDIDGSPATFNSTERNRMVYIWQRVSEDFAVYEIDVTTEDPGVEALRKSNGSDQQYGVRVVIGGSWTNWFGQTAGGVAKVGSFNWNKDTPCWVFPLNLGPNDEKNIAEAASHEAGHTLGLYHDGTTTGDAYYTGQGNWAPIMGVGYYKPIAQWSKGEYANANNTEDDLDKMLAFGAVYRSDDHGGSIATATILAGLSSAVVTNGVIEGDADMDFFRFTAAGGPVTIKVNRAPRDSNLHMQVKLHDAGGTPIFTNTPADNSSSGTQSATNTLTLAGGFYYVSVQGVGSGDPVTTGYSSYASLGQYSVIVSGVAISGSSWQPNVAGVYSWTNQSNWFSNAPPNSIGATALVNNDIAGDQTIQLPTPITLGTLYLGAADIATSFTLEALGGSLVFDNGAAAARLNKFTGGADAITAPVAFNQTLVIDQASTRTLTLGGALTGVGSLVKAGTGTTILAATNTYSGPTTLNAGVLRLGDTNALPGGNLVFEGTNSTGSSTLGLASGDFLRPLGTGPGQVQWTGAGGFAAYGADRTVVFGGTVNWNAGGFVPAGKNLILGASDADATVFIQNNISFAGGNRGIQVNNGSADVDAVLAGVLSSAGGLTKYGAGTLALSASNTYTGDTIINVGTLQISGNGRLGSGNYGGAITGNAALQYSSSADQTFSGVISGTGTLTKDTSDTSTLTLTGQNTFTGLVTVNNGAMKLQGGAFTNTSRDYQIATGAVLNLDGGAQIPPGTNEISGGGILRLTGGGLAASANGRKTILSLSPGALIDVQSGANIYNGGWQAIVWTDNQASLNLNGTLNLIDGNDAVVDALTGAGTFTESGAYNRTLIVGVADGSGTFGGVIQNPAGTVSVTKTGLGTQTFTGSNTYSGPTTINGGTLQVNNTTGSGTGSGTVTVNSSGVLGGTGTIAGAVTVNGGGSLSPGASLGALTINGSLILSAGCTNHFEVNGSTATNDRIQLGAGVAYGGVLHIMPTGTFTNGQAFTLFSGTGVTNASNFSSIAGSPGAGLAFSFTNGVLSVVAAPGPGSPATLTNFVSGGALHLSWPYEGWILQCQTNSLSVGLSTNWVPLTDGSVSSTNIPIDGTRPGVFYRLAYP